MNDTECRCGKPIKQPRGGARRKHCSAKCRAEAFSKTRKARGVCQFTVSVAPKDMDRLRKVAGSGHGLVTRFVRDAVLSALACHR